MADQEQPGFTVVDRRNSTQENAPPQPGAAATAAGSEGASQAPAPQADPSDTAPRRTAESPADLPSESADTSPHEEPFAPDPAMLLSLGAMQMETRDLVSTLTVVFDGHAWRALGFHAHPVTGETQTDLPAAQLAIDCVQFLLGKMEGTLSEPERREVQRRLSDLRMNYLTKLRES